MTDGSADPNDVLAYHLHTASGTFGGEVNTGIDLLRRVTIPTRSTGGAGKVDHLVSQWTGRCGNYQRLQGAYPERAYGALIMSNEVARSHGQRVARRHWTAPLPNRCSMQIGDVQLYQSSPKEAGTRSLGPTRLATRRRRRRRSPARAERDQLAMVALRPRTSTTTAIPT